MKKDKLDKINDVMLFVYLLSLAEGQSLKY